MQPEDINTLDPEIDKETITKIYFVKNNQSIDINIGSCPTLQDLNRNIEDHLRAQQKEENRSRSLYYFNGSKKEWIKDEKDYISYLILKSYSDYLDLYSVERIAPLSGSFKENAQKLVSSYQPSRHTTHTIIQRIQIPRSSENQVFYKYQGMKNANPEQNWLQGEWLKWGKQNVDSKKYNEFRYDIERMFSQQKKQTVIYKQIQMSDKLLQELESSEAEPRGYQHVDNSINAILLSVYNQVAEELGYKTDQNVNRLQRLAAWMERNTSAQINKSVSNFKVTQEIKEIRHTIKSVPTQMGQNLERKKSVGLFSQQKSPEDIKQKYISLNELYHSVSSFFKNSTTLEQFRAAFGPDRNFSDNQIFKFVQKVAKAKAKYLNKIVHTVPKSPQDGVLLPFDDSEKVGILGDWGSGLPDSFDLLDELVLNRGATIILHLGDVYYAGFPEEFKKISDKIKELRKKVPSLRYYTIPGNHDFYTNGGPFYASLNDYNDKQEYKQHFGFFCLRNKSNTVQYIGLDTGFSQRGATDQQSPTYEGAFVGFQELHWAKEKIQNFSGQTILLTHHQAFSPYERTIGKLTNFGYYNNQLDPKLCQQLFEILPKVSVWYWGHEHRLNIMKPNAYGIPCTRTLGNSSFQVHKQTTYELQYNQYNPIIARWNPGRNDKDYFDHTGAVMTFANYKINVRYIDMTSSYKQPSRVTREFEENITRPVHDKVYTNRPYRIKDSSGLSYSYYDSTDDKYIWLHYKPEDFIFQKSDDPTYTGPITSGMEVHIKVAGKNHYLYLNSYVKANKNRLSGAGKFKFVKINMRKKRNNTNIEIRAGDNLQLINCKDMNNNFIGRSYQNFNIKSYYCLATGSNTEYTSVQIYDPTQSNTDIGQ